MTTPAAFRATYSDWKLVKTRQVVQIVFEVPLADADAAYDVIGGMPDPSKERWFGIAPIRAEAARNTPAAKLEPAKHSWRDMPPSQQAGIRCGEAIFMAFLREKHPLDWQESGRDSAECVRLICAVESRSQLNEGAARVIWHQLDTEYQAWEAKERVGA